MPLLVDISVDRKGVQRVVLRDVGKWEEGKHPRGQPENKGEFAKGKAKGQQSTPSTESKPTPLSKNDRLFLGAWQLGRHEHLRKSAEFTRIVHNLPTYNGETWRGMLLSKENAEKFQAGKTFTTKWHSSSSTSEAIGKDFAASADTTKQPVLLRLIGKSGRLFPEEVSDRYYADQREVIIPRGVKYEVKKVETKSGPHKSAHWNRPANISFLIVTAEEV